jgi:hypothetical protein
MELQDHLVYFKSVLLSLKHVVNVSKVVTLRDVDVHKVLNQREDEPALSVGQEVNFHYLIGLVVKVLVHRAIFLFEQRTDPAQELL